MLFIVDKTRRGALLTVIISSHGIKQIIMDGHKYSFHRKNGTSLTRWRCVKQRRGCTAVLMTYDNEIVRYNTDHNHAAPIK
uniref:SFRICE_004114 n=1 Tax=Spodoptera frugiperda TaxID=7108 RepID=A0A2H1VPA1_SPOFR